jgi:outer membrane receptor protein involved in Fe transport
MDGFTNFRVENIDVKLNATATVTATLQLATVAETVTVTGEGPVLDVTKSGLSTNYTSEMVDEMPTNRNFWDLMRVSPGVSGYAPDSQGSRVQAYGSGNQSNNWNIDGISVTSPDMGTAFIWINPDMIEEVEVMGIGASAEYGNATGATLNVVTKSGSNSFHGSANYYFQNDALTDENVVIDGYAFHRDLFRDFAASLGGPIATDKVWFYAGYQHQRDAFTLPGVDPAFASPDATDRIDVKVSAQIGKKHRIDGLFHQDFWALPDAVTPFVTEDATGEESGSNPAWKAALTSVLNDTTLLEVKYAGWWGDDIWRSTTASTEEAFVDWTPPEGGPPTYSGGLYYPWDYIQWTHQFSGKVTKYSEDFLKSQHDFKFGVQFGTGAADSAIGLSATGAYIYNYLYTYNYYGYDYDYRYLYRVVQQPYTYGARTQNLALFVDDTVTVGNRLTLNLGLRYDWNTGDIEPSERLTPDFEPTGESTPGAKDYINWKTWSPRIGFSLQPTASGNATITGFFGVFYEQNVSGNWSTLVELPIFDYFATSNPEAVYQQLLAGEIPPPETFDIFAFDFKWADLIRNFDLKPPRTLQYTLGYEQEIGTDMSVGVRYVHKDSKDFIGWDILGGAWEPVPYTDPFTGNQYQLLNRLDTPELQKGNGPFLTSNIQDLLDVVPRYESDYDAVFVTFNKRFANNWSLMSSYTWSEGKGLLTRPQAQADDSTEPLWTSSEGDNPNNFINARAPLPFIRPHMFRLQGVFNLPADFLLSTGFNISSGVAFSRQVNLFNLGVPGGVPVTMAPNGAAERTTLSDGTVLESLRFPTSYIWDFRIGKRFPIGDSAAIKIDGMLLNALNNDASLWMSTLELNEGDQFVQEEFVRPRRLMIMVGVDF